MFSVYVIGNENVARRASFLSFQASLSEADPKHVQGRGIHIGRTQTLSLRCAAGMPFGEPTCTQALLPAPTQRFNRTGLRWSCQFSQAQEGYKNNIFLTHPGGRP